MGPYSDPVLNIDPGDRVVVETVDAFEGVIKTEQDLPSQKLIIPFLNPQCGPIMVGGAEKGDVVAVYIESISGLSQMRWNPASSAAAQIA
jgi:amidase